MFGEVVSAAIAIIGTNVLCKSADLVFKGGRRHSNLNKVFNACGCIESSPVYKVVIIPQIRVRPKNFEVVP